MMDISKIPEIQEWIEIVENDRPFKCCEEQKLLVKHIRKCFETEEIYVDIEQLDKYMQLAKRYVPFKLLPWEKFIIALHDCTYWVDSGLPRWPDLFCMIGRGAGKDGMIAIESFCLSSPYNPIQEYDVDICANNEDQAMRPVKDLRGWFENLPQTTMKKIKKFFHWTKERITCKKTNSTIIGRTNSPKGKDGLRSGIVIFNEIHQYQNYDNIDVFTTGLGKKEHPRRSMYTTNGDTREGPLDDCISDSEDILFRGQDDNGLLPMICRLKDTKQIDDESNWPMANPSYYYMPSLQAEIKKEYHEWKKNPDRLSTFPNKRFNITAGSKESAVVPWKMIQETNKEIPEVKNWSCTVGIDYTKSTDWMSANFHFKNGNQRYDINKVWICSESKDLHRIKAPWKDWVKRGLAEYVEADEIHPSIVANYIQEMGKKYTIEKVAIDNYRYTLLSDALAKVGISKENGNLVLVKQVDIMKIVPVIEHCFINGYFHWGDNPVLRWATNNTKLIRYGRDQGADKGSYVYAKIEAKSRKTDPFMALVASMIPEQEIKERPKIHKIGVIRI